MWYYVVRFVKFCFVSPSFTGRSGSSVSYADSCSRTLSIHCCFHNTMSTKCCTVSSFPLPGSRGYVTVSIHAFVCISGKWTARFVCKLLSAFVLRGRIYWFGWPHHIFPSSIRQNQVKPFSFLIRVSWNFKHWWHKVRCSHFCLREYQEKCTFF